MVVDVAEPECHLVGDHRELATREASDGIALRDQDAAHLRQLALDLHDLRHQLRPARQGALLERLDPFFERLSDGTVVLHHRIDDPVHERDRPFGEEVLVLTTRVSQALDAARGAIVHRDEIVLPEEEVDVARGEGACPLLAVYPVQHEIEILGILLDLGYWSALRASSMESGWKWKTSFSRAKSLSEGAGRSTQSLTGEDGSSHAGSTRSTSLVVPFS